MQNAKRVQVESPRGTSLSRAATGSPGAKTRNPFLRLFHRPPTLAQEIPETENAGASPILTDIEKENTWLRMELKQFRKEQQQLGGDGPLAAGSGLVAEIVPPIPPSSVRANVGSPSLGGHLFVASSWYCVVSRFLRAGSTVMDMGCGCGKDARNFIYHPYVKKYIGFDVYKLNIDWCQESIVPRSEGRFAFHHVDVYSQSYNPQGAVQGTEVVFPAADGEVQLAFAVSLFTHLLEADAKHYLREVTRVLAPGGLFLPTIHTNPAPGCNYSGNEIRIDVNPEYFMRLATDAGLRLVNRLGAFCGQEAFLFSVD